MTMTKRLRTPSLFRPRKPIDQGVLTENRKLVDESTGAGCCAAWSASAR
jgi:hypothetical protein